MVEASLKLDSLGQNLQYTGNLAIVRQIYNLILMKPGSDPLNIEKGCDARSYYFQIKDDTVLSELQQNITNQISTYTPYSVRNVVCKAILNRNHQWILHIVVVLIDGRSIVVSTNGDLSTLNLIDR